MPPIAAPGLAVPDAGAYDVGEGHLAVRLAQRSAERPERFHAGLDLRAATGQDVHAATDGVVTFAGEQSGYGLVVVVSHGSGLETRYAHLSSADVAEGDRVDAGAVIARSGNSGRSTGPQPALSRSAGPGGPWTPLRWRDCGPSCRGAAATD
ncbi:MAG: M23 family metallopeptidase [Vicinamibacterales bacterium]